MLGSAAESFLDCVLERPIVLVMPHSCKSSDFSFWFWNVALYPGWIGVCVGALYPGWIGVYVSCNFVVIALFCRVVSSLCCCCHFPMMIQAADLALAVKRVIKDQS